MLQINTSGRRHTTDTKLVRRIACEDKFATLQRLKTSISGLPSKDARQRLEKNGPNEIANKPKNTKFQFLCEAFMTPFTGAIFFLAILSLLISYGSKIHVQHELDTTLLIIAVLIISGLLSFIQNIRLRAAIQSLLHKISSTTQVVRDRTVQELATRDLVKGDVILLKAGEVVPADVKLLKSDNMVCLANFFMNEDEVVQKSAYTSFNQKGTGNYLDYSNILYAGTTIVSGSGVGVVFATGQKTIFGKLAQNISKMELKKHIFNFNTKNLAKIFLILAAIIVPIFLLINGAVHGNWANALVFALAVVVGITSDAIPISVTGNLFKDSFHRADSDIIIKNQNQSN